MNEFQIVSLENKEISAWDFSILKSELEKYLEEYKGIVYSSENMSEAKTNRANLNKIKKELEKARSAFMKKCLEPYEMIKPQIKELVGMIDSQKAEIDDVVNEHTSLKKAEKEAEVREYYYKKAFVLGEFTDSLYSKLLNPKWTNVSASKNKVKEEIQIAINKALDDINLIKALKSPFEEVLLKKYVETLSVDKALAKNEELTEATEKAGINNQSGGCISETNDNSFQMNSNNEDVTALKIYGNRKQLNQVFDFMKAIGVNFEVQ